jgi:hypothetical protein
MYRPLHVRSLRPVQMPQNRHPADATLNGLQEGKGSSQAGHIGSLKTVDQFSISENHELINCLNTLTFLPLASSSAAPVSSYQNC